MMIWLHSEHPGFDFTPYAATVIFELYHDEECLASTKDESCFSVHMRDNGIILDVGPDCQFEDGRPGCSFPDFKAFMSKIWYNGKGAPNLDEACFQEMEKEVQIKTL